jgi:formylglycine-generating enzyme required for sulfatase activity
MAVGMIEIRHSTRCLEALVPAPPFEPPVVGRDDMVLISAGEFLMGSPDGEGFSDEHPRHRVHVDAFYIDKYEVTNAQYREFVEATGHREPKGYNWRTGEYRFEPWKDSEFNAPNQPVVCVSWHDAMAYARWAGKRLPTEAEWEKAARGGLRGKKYPLGDNISRDHANYRGTGGRDEWSRTAPVGSFPPNGYGLYDMAGNMWEWCLDEYDLGFYAKSPRRNPFAGGDMLSVTHNITNVKAARVLRGGSWSLDGLNLRVALRYRVDPAGTDAFIGFRCAARSSKRAHITIGGGPKNAQESHRLAPTTDEIRAI